MKQIRKIFKTGKISRIKNIVKYSFNNNSNKDSHFNNSNNNRFQLYNHNIRKIKVMTL
jgi:hypothetical protein